MNQLFFIACALMSIVVWDVDGEEHPLHYVTDAVAGGSYKYYSLTHEGVIKISLNSQIGDTDLYLSQTTNKPTYEPETYCLQSTTCGEDVIIIPPSFKRPVSIGVYGHPAHDTSRFELCVYEIILPEQNHIDAENSIYNFDDDLDSSKTAKKSLILTFLWKLFNELLQAL